MYGKQSVIASPSPGVILSPSPGVILSPSLFVILSEAKDLKTTEESYSG
jgi:hypothetical protein